jgi:pSer/pThr/pTyr-binding forkhead associated (FHA) protein
MILVRLITNRSAEIAPSSIPESTIEWPTGSGEELLEGPSLVLGEVTEPREAFALKQGWTRIGRSPLADIRLDDPSVSRRHALVVRTPDDELQIIDDRSLNGVLVNGKAVHWCPLNHGDELVIGRFRLMVLHSQAPAGQSH